MASGSAGDPDEAERGWKSGRKNERRTGNPIGWGAVYKFGWWIIGVVVVLLLVLLGFVPKFRHLSELQRKREELREEAQRQEMIAQDFRQKQERFTRDPAYVERVAKEAGMIRPDELVFRLTNEQARATNSPR